MTNWLILVPNMPGELTTPERDDYFNRLIWPDFISDLTPSDNPMAVILGGQPGAGKSNFISLLKEKNPNFIEINGDDLRTYHPHFLELLKTDERNAADLTQADVNYWIEKLLDRVSASRSNLIIEGTMRRPEVIRKTLALLVGRDYSMEIDVITATRELSEASIYYRYEVQKNLVGLARMVKPESHVAAIDGIRQTLQELSSSSIANIRLHSRRGGLYTLEYESLYAQEAPDKAFARIISQEMTETEAHYINELWSKTEQLAEQREAENSHREYLRERRREFNKLFAVTDPKTENKLL